MRSSHDLNAHAPAERSCFRTLWATPGPLRGVAGVVDVVRACLTPEAAVLASMPW
jgi:hypothetical protein